MADRAAAALRAVDLSNPVTVIGQSSGGMVALEVARRLRDHDVAAVVLLDTDVPDDRGAADRVAGRVGQRAADLRVAHPRWPEAVVRLGARVRPRLALRIATAGIIMRKPSLQRYVFTAIRARALDRFVPTAYRGRVVLILAAERDDPALPVGSARVVLPARWQTVLGTPVECTVAPGSHATMTDEVNRAALVAVIERALGRVEATCEATYTASA